MASFAQFNPARIRSYIFRLPLCTRVLVAAILGLYIATIPLPWLREFAQLEPAKMDFTQSMSLFFYSIWREKSRVIEWCSGASWTRALELLSLRNMRTSILLLWDGKKIRDSRLDFKQKLIYRYSAPTQLVPRHASQLLPHDLQPRRRYASD